jgi:hypothetical protein
MAAVQVQLMMQPTQEPMVAQVVAVELTLLVHQEEQAQQIKAMLVAVTVLPFQHFLQVAVVVRVLWVKMVNPPVCQEMVEQV